MMHRQRMMHRLWLTRLTRRETATMGTLRERFRYTWIAHFAKPASQRCLHRAVRRQRVRRILELGIGDASRAKALIRTAAIDGGATDVTYAAIDLFEARPALSVVDDFSSDDFSNDDPNTDAHQPLPLKEAYRRLRSTGAQIRLLPGDPYSALARGANDLGQLDMIIMGADVDPESLQAAWFYVPRLLHDETQFWTARRDDEGEVRYELTALADIHALGREATARRRATSVVATTKRVRSMRRAA